MYNIHTYFSALSEKFKFKEFRKVLFSYSQNVLKGKFSNWIITQKLVKYMNSVNVAK